MFQKLFGKSIIPAFFVTAIAFSAIAQAAGSPAVWIAPSMHRVGMNDQPGSNQEAKLSAARGEYESFQIIASGASGALSNVDVTISDLRGPAGQVIPSSAFILYREKYMQVTSSSPNWKGTNQPLPPGWYPDALIPFTDPETGRKLSGAQLTAVPFKVESGKNQPIWVDLLVPQTAAAGQYSGTYTVTSDQGKFTGPISLKVWNFALPKSPALKSSFLFFTAGTLAAQKEMLRHKIFPASTNPQHQAELKEMGLGATNTGPFSGADIGRCAMQPAPSVEQFKALKQKQQPGLLHYNYSADEVGHCSNIYPTIKQWAKNMHAAGIQNLISMSPNPGLFDDGSGSGRSAVDIWVLLPVMYEKSKAHVGDVLKKGDTVWSYNTLIQDAYSPKWEIDFDPINFRIQPGFISQSLNLTGLLYWRVDRWTSDPWNNINNAGTYSSSNYPGEGALVYPGQQVGVNGVVASMRMKWLRDGVEDYDYMDILKKLGREDLAMQVARSIGPDWTNWTRDKGALESARVKLGEAIDQAMAKKAGSSASVR